MFAKKNVHLPHLGTFPITQCEFGFLVSISLTLDHIHIQIASFGAK
jgi:hypothetical protein